MLLLAGCLALASTKQELTAPVVSKVWVAGYSKVEYRVVFDVFCKVLNDQTSMKYSVNWPVCRFLTVVSWCWSVSGLQQKAWPPLVCYSDMWWNMMKQNSVLVTSWWTSGLVGNSFSRMRREGFPFVVVVALFIDFVVATATIHSISKVCVLDHAARYVFFVAGAAFRAFHIAPDVCFSWQAQWICHVFVPYEGRRFVVGHLRRVLQCALCREVVEERIVEVMQDPTLP